MKIKKALLISSFLSLSLLLAPFGSLPTAAGQSGGPDPCVALYSLHIALTKRVALAERRLASPGLPAEMRARWQALIKRLTTRIEQILQLIAVQCPDLPPPIDQPSNPGSILPRALSQRGCYTLSPVISVIPEGGFPKGHAAVDIDNDGDNDVIGISQSGSLALLASNNGRGEFDLSKLFPPDQDPGVGANDAVNNTFARDLDGDGDIDLAVADHSSISILVNKFAQGEKAFEQTPVLLNVGGFGVTSMAMGDLNGDGRDDLVFKSYGRRINGQWVTPIGVLINNSISVQNPSFTNAVLIGQDLPLNSIRSVVSLGDVVGNSAPDILIPVYPSLSINATESPFIAVFENRGDGTFKAPIRISAGVFKSVQALPVDLNGDGSIEIVVADRDSGAVRVLAKRAGIFYLTRPTFQPDSGYAVSMLTSTDVNRDGYLDIILASDTFYANPPDNMPRVLYGNGTIELSAPEKVVLGDPFDPASRFSVRHARNISLADLTGDGAPELMMLDWFNSVLAAKNQCIR